ncbi:hypothetical protein Dimus_006542 [Dionaea muscipula]
MGSCCSHRDYTMHDTRLPSSTLLCCRPHEISCLLNIELFADRVHAVRYLAEAREELLSVDGIGWPRRRGKLVDTAARRAPLLAEAAVRCSIMLLLLAAPRCHCLQALLLHGCSLQSCCCMDAWKLLHGLREVPAWAFHVAARCYLSR